MKLTSLMGILALIGVAWLLSEHRRRFPWRAVLWGLALQFLLGWFILKTGPGERIFEACQRMVSRFIGAGVGFARLVAVSSWKVVDMLRPYTFRTIWGRLGS